MTDASRRHVTRSMAAIAIASLIAATAATAAGGSPARTPIRDCGDITAAAGAITAQGVPCRQARFVARFVPASKTCRPYPASGTCTTRGFTCLIGQAGKELFLAQCQDQRQEGFIRFEYGS